VLFDNVPVYANKALFQGTFEHRSKLAGHDVRVTVEDTFEGYLYDLIVDNVMFHRMPRKTVAELEVLRTEKKSGVTVQTDFAAFTGKSKSALDGDASADKKKEKKKEKAKEDESLIDLDWDAAVRVQAPRPVAAAPPPAAAQAQFNPFESNFSAPPPQQQQQQQGSYDPFGGNTSYNSYAMPSAIPQQQSFQAAPQQQYYPQQQQQQPAYDPFSSYAQPVPQAQHHPQYPPQAQRPPPQPQQPYDPFGAF